MESQSQDYSRPGDGESTEQPTQHPTEQDWAAVVPGMPPPAVQNFYETPEHDRRSAQPTAREIEDGAIQEATLYDDYTGANISQTPMDEKTKRILFALHNQRKGWSKSMADDAGAALQLLYPDVGGSKVNGPL